MDVIYDKPPKHNARNSDGAKAAIEEVSGGDPATYHNTSFLDYELLKDNSDSTTFTQESLERGRGELDAAFRRIREPWRIFFDDMICRDCGMAGDERLLPPKCHDEEVVEERRACAGIPGTKRTYRVFESVEDNRVRLLVRGLVKFQSSVA